MKKRWLINNSYDEGYNDMEEGMDYDPIRYERDRSYADGVDAAMDDIDDMDGDGDFDY